VVGLEKAWLEMSEEAGGNGDVAHGAEGGLVVGSARGREWLEGELKCPRLELEGRKGAVD